VNTVTVGTAIAATVAGWPLYELVTAGTMDATTALVRGGVVAGGCAIGVGFVVRLALGYEAQAEAQRRRRLGNLFQEMESAVADGALTEAASPTSPERAARAAGADPGRG
jgi:hypothetical protein